MAANFKLVNWQKPMRNVLYACAPLMALSVYLFGWRAAAMFLLAAAAAWKGRASP